MVYLYTSGSLLILVDLPTYQPAPDGRLYEYTTWMFPLLVVTKCPLQADHTLPRFYEMQALQATTDPVLWKIKTELVALENLCQFYLKILSLHAIEIIDL
jgi:hypothetical protein